MRSRDSQAGSTRGPVTHVGSIILPRRRTSWTSFSRSACAMASGAFSSAILRSRFASSLRRAASMSLRLRPSISSTVVGRNCRDTCRVRSCSSAVSKKPAAGLRSKATSRL